MRRGIRILLQKGDDLRSLAGVGHAAENSTHIVVWNNLVGLCDPFIEGLLVPRNTRVFYRVGISKTWDRAGLTTHHAIKGRTKTIVALIEGVTLAAVAVEVEFAQDARKAEIDAI